MSTSASLSCIKVGRPRKRLSILGYIVRYDNSNLIAVYSLVDQE